MLKMTELKVASFSLDCLREKSKNSEVHILCRTRILNEEGLTKTNITFIGTPNDVREYVRWKYIDSIFENKEYGMSNDIQMSNDIRLPSEYEANSKKTTLEKTMRQLTNGFSKKVNSGTPNGDLFMIIWSPGDYEDGICEKNISGKYLIIDISMNIRTIYQYHEYKDAKDIYDKLYEACLRGDSSTNTGYYSELALYEFSNNGTYKCHFDFQLFVKKLTD